MPAGIGEASSAVGCGAVRRRGDGDYGVVDKAGFKHCPYLRVAKLASWTLARNFVWDC